MSLDEIVAAYDRGELDDRRSLRDWALLVRELRDDPALVSAIERFRRVELGTEYATARALTFLNACNDGDVRAVLARLLGVAPPHLELALRWFRCRMAWRARLGRPLDHAYRRIDVLDAAQLDELIARLHHTRKRTRDVPATAVERIVMVSCGKPTCACRRGEKHGPYRYAYWRENGRMRSRYLGRVDFAGVELVAEQDELSEVAPARSPRSPRRKRSRGG